MAKSPPSFFNISPVTCSESKLPLFIWLPPMVPLRVKHPIIIIPAPNSSEMLLSAFYLVDSCLTSWRRNTHILMEKVYTANMRKICKKGKRKKCKREIPSRKSHKISLTWRATHCQNAPLCAYVCKLHSKMPLFSTTASSAKPRSLIIIINPYLKPLSLYRPAW